MDEEERKVWTRFCKDCNQIYLTYCKFGRKCKDCLIKGKSNKRKSLSTLNRWYPNAIKN